MNSLFIFDEIGDILSDALRTLIFTLSTYIYKLIIWIYNIFYRLCNSRILDSATLEVITDKVGLILGIVMLFMILFSVIQMVLEPDKLTDKEKGMGNIVKKIILVIVMLGISKSAFSALYKIQQTIIDSNIIAKFILPYQYDSDNFGGILSSEIFSAFFKVDSDFENSSHTCVVNYSVLRNLIALNGDFSVGNICVNAKSDDKYVIDFNLLLLPVVGIFVAYYLICYCVSVGVRTIQLAFLEIISPMAIISYLSPKKDTMFEKWWKIYFSTYIDVFIRIMIISLIALIISAIFESENVLIFWESVGGQQSGDFIIEVFMVLALLTFAKKAPELLKKLFPASDGSGIGFGASMKNIVGLKEGIGMISGATTGAMTGLIGGIAGGKGFSRITGAFGGVLGGALRGGKAGFGAKGVGKAITSASSNQAKSNLARAQRIASGSTLGERTSDKLKGVFGIQSGYSNIDTTVSLYDNLNSLINDEDVVKDYQKIYDTAVEQIGKAESETERENLMAKASQAEAQLKAVKAYMFHCIKTGETFSAGQELVDAQGNSFYALKDIKANDSMKNSLNNLERVTKKEYLTLNEFKAGRNEAKANKIKRTNAK